GNAELSDSLRNRSFPLEARRALVARLSADRVHPVSARLLARAAAARVRTLPLTVASYLDVAARLAEQQIAKVTVARPLDEERTERLRRALEATVGAPISLQIEIDPSVLGGMDVQLGDHIIESTVAGRLDDARRLLTTH
ncbi:MAG: F0F1 ATP synthase subunit delta, partial [Arachnia sp.]